MQVSLRARDVLSPSPVGSVSLGGYIGEKLELCMKHRVMSQDIEKVVGPFRERSEGPSQGFRCEYWGKWFTSLALAFAYQPTAAHRAKLDNSVEALLTTQSPDGYIGTYEAPHHLGWWDVWGRKYVLLGLLAYYDLTKDQKALAAACRAADHLRSETGPGPGKKRLVDIGIDVLKGLAPSSVLEPILLLYQRTGDANYLRYAQDLVAQWSTPSAFASEGMRLLEDVVAGIPPLKIASPKGYEMMSCYEGICELYRITGEKRYLEAAVKLGHSILQTERMIDGSGSNKELWCDGVRVQTEVLEQPQETCVTVTWMKFCCQLLRVTGDPVWADELEISLYNALLAAMTPDGRWWSYYTGLQGQRVPSAMQHEDVGLSCCVANGPRGLLLTPRWAAMVSETGPVINLYAPGRAVLPLADGSEVCITQTTDYPAGDTVKLTIGAAGSKRFALSLRIPAWSRRTTLSVNGQAVPCEPGSYARIERMWAPGDVIELRFDLRGRAVMAPSGAPDAAVMRGPILLSLDSRMCEPENVCVYLAQDAEGFVELTPRAQKPAGVFLAFDVGFDVRPTHFFNHKRITLGMCDFASAGNTWRTDQSLRTWLPQPLYLRTVYPPETWRLINPELQQPPQAP